MYAHDEASPVLGEGEIALAQLQSSGKGAAVFGDGSHATTRLCATAVDWLCARRKPRDVLDVGTGSGVLARIARARGACFVVGTDIDPIALESARAHSMLDAHGAEIHYSSELPDHWGPRFDLVVANILEEPLRVLAPHLVRALERGGTLLISGFTRPQAPVLRLSYERLGLTFTGSSDLEEWTALMFKADFTDLLFSELHAIHQ
jgi:ribosomal protein L11 methyltransferase